MLSFIELVIFWLIFDEPYLMYRSLLYYSYNKKLSSLFKPNVTILIPAYNESLTIKKH